MNEVFDFVVLVDRDARRTVTAQAFFSLPLAERIRYVLTKNIEFYRGSLRLEVEAVLAELRRANAK